jgi:hypothetical protein
MKKCDIFVGAILCAVALGCIETPAPEKKEGEEPTPSATAKVLAGKSGKDLFRETALGTSNKSCNTCHPDGEGLSGVGERLNQQKELERMINKCIAGPLKGKELDLSSPEMTALTTYLRSL